MGKGAAPLSELHIASFEERYYNEVYFKRFFYRKAETDPHAERTDKE